MARGLFAIHTYRYLSVAQFARASGLKVSHVRDQLRTYERKNLLGSFGNNGRGKGAGKTLKLYYLTRSGYRAMLEALELEIDQLGGYVPLHRSTRWSQKMQHRLATVDIMLAVEEGALTRSTLELVAMFFEYRRKDGAPETSDYVTLPKTSANRIVPDAGFVILNTTTDKRGLFLIEADMRTEQITRITERTYSLRDKFAQYERYLLGGRFAETYAGFGEFSFFTMLFVTTTRTRIDNIRMSAKSTRRELHPYIRLATLDEASADFFGPIWVSRDAADETPSSIVSA